VAAWELLAAPLDCAGRSEGEERAPRALLVAGAAKAAGTERRAIRELDTRLRSSERDPASGVIDVEGVRRATAIVGEAVDGVLAAGRRPLVLGGDCTLAPGILDAATRRSGEFGLVFFDGHPDACDGETSPTGEAADMDLAVLTGRGPEALRPGDRPGPVVDPRRIALIGVRGDAPADISLDDGRTVQELELLDPGVHRIDAGAVREMGPEPAAERALEAVARNGRVWVHLDVDVLDQSVMPAVSYPQPNGPSVEDLTAILARVAASAEIAGAQVTCFNPDLDPDGRCAERVIEMIRALAGTSPG
jgi:arginase